MLISHAGGDEMSARRCSNRWPWWALYSNRSRSTSWTTL